MRNLLLLPYRAVFLVLSVGLSSCGSPSGIAATPAAQAKAAEDSLLTRHDQIMGQAERISILKAQLLAAKVPAKAPVVARLETAYQGMMGWMHAYQAPDSLAPAAQRLTYLRGQQRQLTGVEKQLTTALDSAQATLRRAGR